MKQFRKSIYRALNSLTAFSLCSFLGVAELNAAPLAITEKPLFLGNTVEPNVFFDVDDSGSMDWEILTKNHWHYCAYDSNAAGNSGSNDCGSLVNNGLITTYTGSSFQNFEYIFADKDHAYSLDCSGSSGREAYEACTSSTAIDADWRVRSSDLNVIYYNPNLTYKPWVGTTPALTDADFKGAHSDPQPGTAGNLLTPRDLSGFVYEEWLDGKGFAVIDGRPRRGANINFTNGDNEMVDLWDTHRRFTVTAGGIIVEEIRYAPDSTGLNPKTDLVAKITDMSTPNDLLGKKEDGTYRTGVEALQNIANWYQYSRKRSYATKGAIAQVVTQKPNFRYGLTVINNYTSLFQEVPAATETNFEIHNRGMLKALFEFDWPAMGTPLRRGLERAGKYYDAAVKANSEVEPIISECQQNYTVLFTDGYWNGGHPSGVIGDADGDGKSGNMGRRFGTTNITVADVAKYYYDRDLSPLANNVSSAGPDSDNKKQHMVTFTVAFGVEGLLKDTDVDGKPNPELADNGDWGNPISTSTIPEKIDDLWHAAQNSRGAFVSAKTPGDVVDGLSSALSIIEENGNSSAAVATNSTALNAGARIFQARFDSGSWTGDLRSIRISAPVAAPDPGDPTTTCPGVPIGQICSTGGWQVGDDYFETTLFDPDKRVVVSYNPAEKQGVAFRWPSDYTAIDDSDSDLLSSSQVTELLENALAGEEQDYGQSLVEYLRGHKSDEGKGRNFRIREKRLGDIVNSDPVFVGAPAFRYPDNLESVAYSSYKKSHKDRLPVVYVGANDGMLHGFNANTGAEVLAYIPNSVFADLDKLADPAYTHRYYVNGAPTVGDAFFSSQWRTVLVSGLAHGGKGIFALDVSDPAGGITGANAGPKFSESKADELVLWEFTDNDHADLGFTFSRPAIVRMANGKWAAVFGNGYNSKDGKAVLFIVDIEDGSVIQNITAEKDSGDNGLSTVAPVDIDGDSIIDYIYAGDLKGNLWKFDVNSTDEDNWKVSYGQPLFKAVSATGAAQPITTRPNVGFHPKKKNWFMVYFGTGKYLEYGDNLQTGQETQTFYGIIDKNESTLSTFVKSDLLEQKIIHQTETKFDLDGDGDVDDEGPEAEFNLRVSTDNQISDSDLGWYIDLINTEGNSPVNQGEKQVTNSILRNGRIIFTTLIPNKSICESGGTGWLMELDAADGSKLGVNPFDFNQDGDFDSKDNAKNAAKGIDDIVSGKQSKVGLISQPTVLYGAGDGDDGGCFGSHCGDEFKYASGSSGGVEVTRENPGKSNYGRQTWREVSR